MKKKETIRTGIVVSTVEYLAFTTLQELVESVDNTKIPKKPPSYNEGDEDNVVLSDDTFHEFGAHEEDSSYAEVEKEQKDENMVGQDLDWMTQGPLVLPDILHKMPRHPEKLLTKYCPNKVIKT